MKCCHTFFSSAKCTKTRLTFGTIPGSCQTSVRRLWASLAVVLWGWGRGWKMVSGQERRRLGGSPRLWPSGWKSGRSQCTGCGTGGPQETHNKIWLFQVLQEEFNRFLLAFQHLCSPATYIQLPSYQAKTNVGRWNGCAINLTFVKVTVLFFLKSLVDWY